MLNTEPPYSIKLTPKFKKDSLNYSWFLNKEHLSFDEVLITTIDSIINHKITLVVFDSYSEDIKTKDFNIIPKKYKALFNNIDMAFSKNLQIDYFKTEDYFILHDEINYDYYKLTRYSDYVYEDDKDVFEVFTLKNNELTKNIIDYKRLEHEELDREYENQDYGYIDLPNKSFQYFYINNDVLNLVQLTPFNHFYYTYYEDNHSGKESYNYEPYNKHKYYYKHSIFNESKENIINDFVNERYLSLYSPTINYLIFNEINILLNYNSYLLTIDPNEDKINFINENYIEIYDQKLFSYKNNYKLLGKYHSPKEHFLYYDFSLNNIDTNSTTILNKFTDKILDLKSINDNIFIRFNKNQIYKYDIEKDEILNTIESELDTIQVMEELNGNLVLFGNKDGDMAYQILNDDYSYFYKYEDVKGTFINAKTNNKDKYVAQVKFDIDTTNTYVIYNDIYAFLRVNLNQDNPISVFSNVIVSKNNIDEVYIYDLLGSKVLSEENYTGTVFHLNSLKQGFYLYRIKSNNNYFTGKFIKE